MTQQSETLNRVRLILEDAESWARNYLNQPPGVRKVDGNAMAEAIRDALVVIRAVKH